MRLRLLIVLALFVFGISAVFAQDGSLPATIDARAAANGLPSGDGVVSPAEQAVAEAVWNEINAFSQDVNDFASSSPENGAWVDSAEQTVQDFNQQVTNITSDSTRASIIANAVEQYGQNVDALQAQAPLGPRAQAIHDAVEQYGSEPVIDPRGQAIHDAVEQYGQDIVDPRAQAIHDAVEQYGQEIVDPRAKAIHDAVEQYGQENAQAQGQGQLSIADQQRLAQTVRESASTYIDNAGINHPGITKRRINHLVQIMVPQQTLPTNGYWRVSPYSVSATGHCINDWGDNDGPSANDPSDPGQPLCGYANQGALPFIVWENENHPYLPGSSSIYSREPQVDYQLNHNGSGASLSSVRTTTTREYEVVAPGEIHVHLFIQEDSGCSLSADYTLVLVTANEAVCPAMQPSAISTPEPTEPPPVVEQGTYRAGLPLITDANQCSDATLPPEFDAVHLLEQPDRSVVVDYGSGTQVVYPGSSGYYEFDTGSATSVRRVISLVLFDGGASGSISWSANAKDGKICYVSRDLTLESAAPNGDLVSTPAAPAASDSSGADQDAAGADSTGAASGLPTGNYAVTWADIPGAACPDDLKPKLPGFAQATIAAAEGGYTLSAGSDSYLLTLSGANYMYIQFANDNSGSTIVVAPGDNGHLAGSYTYFSPAGVVCLNQLDFAPAP